MYLVILDLFSQKYSSIEFNENPSRWFTSAGGRADGRKDGHTHMAKLIVAYAILLTRPQKANRFWILQYKCHENNTRLSNVVKGAERAQSVCRLGYELAFFGVRVPARTALTVLPQTA